MLKPRKLESNQPCWIVVFVNRAGRRNERAMATPPRALKDRRKWLQLARENGINKATFYTRIRNLGWSRIFPAPRDATIAELLNDRKRVLDVLIKERRLPSIISRYYEICGLYEK